MYHELIGNLVEKVTLQEKTTTIASRCIREMPNEGLSKIRYVGAWAIRKIFSKYLGYVRQNMGSHCEKTQTHVEKNLSKCNLIEEFLMEDISSLQKSSSCPETLKYTENNQYRSRGLTHISDVAFEFFINLEEFRVSHLNNSMLKIHQEMIVDQSIQLAQKNPTLENAWERCFPEHENEVFIS